jgi:hypothetical protein
MVLTKVEASMMLIWLVGRRMEVEVALKVPVYLNSCRRNQILSMRLPFFNISPNIVHSTYRNHRYWNPLFRKINYSTPLNKWIISE